MSEVDFFSVSSTVIHIYNTTAHDSATHRNTDQRRTRPGAGSCVSKKLINEHLKQLNTTAVYEAYMLSAI